MTLQKVMKVVRKELHDLNGEIGGGEEADTEELYDVRVTEVFQAAALVDEVLPTPRTFLHKDTVQPLLSAQGATEV